MNLSNYALIVEHTRNGYFQMNEGADQQNDQGLKNVLSGQNGGIYSNQWNSLMADYKSKNGKPGTYTFMVNHDTGKPMVNLTYQIGQDGKPVKGSIKLAAGGSSAGSGKWDANKFLNFNANGKLYEVVSAMITVCIEKLGNDWGPNHVAWVKEHLVYAANGNTSCMQLRQGQYADLNFLKTDGTVRKFALACNDAPTQIKNNPVLKNAGDAKDLNSLNSVIAAIKTKLDETVTVEADEQCLISCYEFISPKISQAQIESAWQNLGMGKGGPLSAIVNEKDRRNDLWGKALGAWALGSRLGNANPQAISACGLDKAAHDAAVVAIRAALS